MTCEEFFIGILIAASDRISDDAETDAFPFHAWIEFYEFVSAKYPYPSWIMSWSYCEMEPA